MILYVVSGNEIKLVRIVGTDAGPRAFDYNSWTCADHEQACKIASHAAKANKLPMISLVEDDVWDSENLTFTKIDGQDCVVFVDAREPAS